MSSARDKTHMRMAQARLHRRKRMPKTPWLIGKARIQATATRTQLGKADLRKTVSRTQLGKAAIV